MDGMDGCFVTQYHAKTAKRIGMKLGTEIDYSLE